MDKSLQRSSDGGVVAELRQAIARGDWEMARSASERLAAEPPPESPEGLNERAKALRELITAASAARAHLAASLTRVSAAKRFADEMPERQNLVEPMRF